MNDWSAGYVTDIGYTFGYYSELNPLHIKLVFLSNGLHFPEVGTACELGFGQGMSVNIHAAASITTWSGTDFNPSQTDFAQDLAKVSGSNAQLFDEAFAEFGQRTDLPDFDYIGLHGIWSWINDDNRAIIVDFIKRKLKVGGVLYISYNTQPGWATMIPMRDLLTEHAEVMGRGGSGILNRIEDALEFADKLMAVNPAFARTNPLVIEKLKHIKTQNRNYLAHEYFNKDWLPMPFSQMAKWLEPTKLQFACSANMLEYVEGININAEQKAILTEIPDTMFQQTVRDFITNQQFRKDYWVKGIRKLSALEQAENLRKLKFILVLPASEISLKVKGALGEANLNEAIYTPIITFLADYKIKTFAEIENALKDKDISFNQLLQAILVLSGNGAIMPAQENKIVTQAKKLTDKLNLHLINLSRGSNNINYLASPVTGGGILLSRFQQLFLQAYLNGQKLPSEWAAYTWGLLAYQGEFIIKEGNKLETKEENITELNAQAQAFHDHKLIILKALQII